MEKHTSTGKVYIITNTDDKSQFYVGSTVADYLAKRYYRHKISCEKGCKSYGNLFDTPNHTINTIYACDGLCGIDLRIKERFYYDKLKAAGLTPTNQHLPYSTDNDKKIARAKSKAIYYQKVRTRQSKKSVKSPLFTE